MPLFLGQWVTIVEIAWHSFAGVDLMRYFRATLVALLFGAMTVPSQAFLFLLALSANQKPSPPLPPLELPPLNLDKPIRPSGLPAPLLTTPQDRAMPRLEQQLAQNNADELRELRRRLDQLEEENRRLRGQSGQDSPAPRGGLPSSRLPMQVSHGWWVHVHEWNDQGNTDNGPLVTYRYDQQEFRATIGFNPENRMFWRDFRIFRLEAWLRIKEAGSYQIGAIVACARDHPCQYSLALDGVRIAQYRGPDANTQQTVFATRHLEPGDYRLEMTYHITINRIILVYEPWRVAIRPLIRTKNDMNFRNFRPDELLVPDRRDVPIGPPIP